MWGSGCSANIASSHRDEPFSGKGVEGQYPRYDGCFIGILGASNTAAVGLAVYGYRRPGGVLEWGGGVGVGHYGW